MLKFSRVLGTCCLGSLAILNNNLVESLMLVKSIVVLVMIAILISLFRSGYYLVKDAGKTERNLMSLKWRIGLSIALFVALFIGFALGYIKPHSL